MSADAHSSNPFRRKGNGPITSPPLATKSPYNSSTAFFDDVEFTPPKSSDAASSISIPAAHPERNPANDIADTKTKPIKRVRVQTPPPLSPDTEPNTPTSSLPAAAAARSGRGDDPFDSAGSSTSDTEEERPRQSGPPRNPFSRTLEDVERSHLKDAHLAEEKERSASKASRASLNVEAFHRLLLTGQAPSNDAQHQPSPAESSTPRKDSSIFAPTQSPPELRHERTAEPASFDTPRGSRDLDHNHEHDDRASPHSESSMAMPLKKKPPPPSSRHGRLIKLELGAGESTSKRISVTKPPPPIRRPSDPNKPLPPAPIRKPSEEGAESIFDMEAAGKVPEVSGPPSPAASVQEQPGVIKRPTPAPPPRRAKTDSSVPDHRASIIGPSVHISQLQRGPSSESLRSRTESIRHPAPAPPPPRRPAAGHRSTGSITSPSSQSFTPSPLTSPLGIVEAAQHPLSPLHQRTHSSVDTETLAPTSQKLAPPRPPTRNPSTRRQQSISGIEGAGKRPPTRDKDLVPPPPPRRQRGGSRSSIETPPETSRRSSVDDGRRNLLAPHAAVGTLREVDENVQPDQNRSAGQVTVKGSPVAEGDGSADTGQGGAILADLDALRREVDALKQRYASESHSTS